MHVIRQQIQRNAIIQMIKPFERSNDVLNKWVTKLFEQFNVANKCVTKLFEQIDVSN